jgi:hypothetical protein
MIQIASIHHSVSSQPYIIRTKTLTLGSEAKICLMIRSHTEHTASIIEEFFLENIGEISWEETNLDDDFSYITEKYNKFIKNLDLKDEHVSIFFGVNKEEQFVFSMIGEIYMFMKESNRKWASIGEMNPHGGNEFSYVSSGIIPYESSIYISTSDLIKTIGTEVLEDMAKLNGKNFEDTMVEWLNKEIDSSIDIIRIERERMLKKWSHRIQQASILQGKLESYIDSIAWKERTKNILREIDIFFHTKPKFVQTGILISGIILSFFLLYILFSEVFNISTEAPTTDTKQQLIEAKWYMETAEKNLSNKSLFDENIKKAEELLFSLRQDEVYLKDTQDMLEKISTMKKELHDIETYEIPEWWSIIAFNPQDISPIKIFEFNKKLTLVGKYGAIVDYVEGTSVPKVTAYPLWEEAIDADISADGALYILTKNNRILSRRQNSIVYVAVNGQESWKASTKVRAYNSNLYLIGSSKNEIFRHRPGTNGFGPEASILSGYSGSDIIDIGIDGWFFLLKNNNQIRRIITSPNYTDEWVTLNNIPGDYSLSWDANTSLFVRPNLTYIYLLDGNRVWIFEPDSRNYKDIKSWKYIAQIDIASKEEIRSIFIPYDGLIYVASNLGAYTIKYEIVDGKIILK